MSTRFLLVRMVVFFARSTGRAFRTASLPAFFGRLVGNSGELRAALSDAREQVKTFQKLYDQERKERQALQDRLLERVGARAVYAEAPATVEINKTSNPAAQSQSEWEREDELREVEHEAMMAASDETYMNLAVEAAVDNPEWQKVVERAKQIQHQAGGVPAYGESSEWPT